MDTERESEADSTSDGLENGSKRPALDDGDESANQDTNANDDSDGNGKETEADDEEQGESGSERSSRNDSGKEKSAKSTSNAPQTVTEKEFYRIKARMPNLRERVKSLPKPRNYMQAEVGEQLITYLDTSLADFTFRNNSNGRQSSANKYKHNSTENFPQIKQTQPVQGERKRGGSSEAAVPDLAKNQSARGMYCQLPSVYGQQLSRSTGSTKNNH